MADKKSMRVDAAAVTDVVVDAAKKQAWAIASRIAKAGGRTPEEIVTIAKSAAAATEQTLVRVAKSAASASAASGSGRAPLTKRRKSANRSGGDLNSQEQSASRHASATSDAASGGSSTSTPTIYLDLTAPVPDNGDTPMAPSTARSAPGFVIRAPLVPGYWLGPRVDVSLHDLGALSPASREATCMRSVHTGFMEPSLLVRAASFVGALYLFLSRSHSPPSLVSTQMESPDSHFMTEDDVEEARHFQARIVVGLVVERSLFAPTPADEDDAL